MLMREIRAFHEKEIGIRKLALPSSVLDPLFLDMVSSLMLIMKDSIEPYWQEWGGDSSLVHLSRSRSGNFGRKVAEEPVRPLRCDKWP